MILSLVIDTPDDHFTNLDAINGRVQLRVFSGTSVSSIVVKLEGESKTQLATPRSSHLRDHERQVIEAHKLLYMVKIVWPPPRMQNEGWNKKAYPLDAGKYEYPFQFNLPLNSACVPRQPPSNTAIGILRNMEGSSSPLKHVRAGLPPTLSGLAGMADIRYFVKATVHRPQFFKENPRTWVYFNFVPIEPPMPVTPPGEAYARRQHQFSHFPPAKEAKKENSIASFFLRRPSSSNSANPVVETGKDPPRFSVEARVPSPTIFTCNDFLPLRVFVKQLNERSEPLYLQTLHIELIGYNDLRAHEVEQSLSHSFVIISMSNMKIPIGSPEDVVGTETPIDQSHWKDCRIPKTANPSFTTCNITLHYVLDVRVGLGYGSMFSGLDQLHIFSLRLPVRIFSGIVPPAALLEAMDMSSPIPPPLPPRPLFLQSRGLEFQSLLLQPQPQGLSHAHSQLGMENDAQPPSYEDAISGDYAGPSTQVRRPE